MKRDELNERLMEDSLSEDEDQEVKEMDENPRKRKKLFDVSNLPI